MGESTCNHYNLTHKLLARRDPETQNLTGLPYKSGKIQAQLSVPFVSTLLYRDALCLLYDCTQFVFASPKCVKWFLDRVPKRAQAVIKHVELRPTMYNEVSLMRHRELKLRSDKNWYWLCERMFGSEGFACRSCGHDGLRCAYRVGGWRVVVPAASCSG
ncbi:hypothetical protein BDW71DRAFT_30567 [Aspergillus fruticulosus]